MKIELKYQACNLSDALCRNINDNFRSVSFEILHNGDIRTKIVLMQLTKKEEMYIDDLMSEYTALQERNRILKPIVEIGNGAPLQNIVYFKV